MVNAGELAELINAEDVTLTNQTDSLTFGQLFNITWGSKTPTNEHVNTSGTRDTTDLPDLAFIEGDILITQPEITTFVGYRAKTAKALTAKNWDIGFTAFNTTTDTIRIVAKMVDLQFLGPEEGGAWFHIRLESETGLVTEP